MPTTTTTISGILKQVYGENMVAEQQNLSAYLWEKLGKATEKPAGQGFFFPVHLSGNLAIGPMNEEESLRRAQVERAQQAKILPKIYTATVQITGLSDAISKGGDASFVNGLDYQFREALKSIRKNMNQELYLDGKGTRSLASAAVVASVTIPVFDAQLFRQNMVLDGYDAAGVTRTFAGVQVTDVNLATNVITMAATISIPINGILCLSEVREAMPADGKSLMGLKGIVDTTTVSTTYLTISRATNRIWQGNVIDEGAVALSNDLLQRACDRVFYISGEKPSLMLSAPSQRRQYLATVTPLKRFTKNMLDSGFDTLEWNGSAWNVDVDCPKDVVYHLSWEDIQRFVVMDLNLSDYGGDVLKWYPNHDMALAYYKWYGNVAARHPNRHMRQENLAKPSF